MLTGSCLCGAVRWKYSLKLESVTACNCGLCARYGALWAYGHLEEGIEVTGPTTKFERGQKGNGFHFCEVCGCVAYYMSNRQNEQGWTRAAVNLRMISDSDPSAILDLPIDHFDGRVSFEDLPRDGRCVKDLWF